MKTATTTKTSRPLNEIIEDLLKLQDEYHRAQLPNPKAEHWMCCQLRYATRHMSIKHQRALGYNIN